MTDELVHGWKAAAAVVGVSERYIRQIAAERGLVVGRRADRAVALRRADMEGLRAELRYDGADPGPAAHGTGAGQGAVRGAAHDTPAPGMPVATSPARVMAAVSSADPGKALSSPNAVGGEAEDRAGEGAGNAAAVVFADMAAGRTLREIVVSRKLAPAAVRQHHDEWTALAAVDGLRTPSAEARLAETEKALAAQHEALEQQAGDIADVATLRQEVAALGRRLAALERRPAGDRSATQLSGLSRRLDAVEVVLKAVPVAPLVVDRICGCGNRLYVMAACSNCGAGLAAIT